MKQEALALAIDLGGTQMRAALVDRAGFLLAREMESTLAHLGRERALERLILAIGRLMLATPGREVVGIGVALASPVDPDTGTMISPPNLPEWDGFSPKALLGDAYGLPVWAGNDAILGAMGEYAYGVGQRVRDLVYVAVGTGIGGGIILDGRPLLGAGGFAGEVGHMTVDRDGPLCGCGNVGCLETLASGTAIANLAIGRLDGGARGLVEEMVGGDLSRVSAEVVMEAAARGDSMAGEVVAQFAEDLGTGIVNLIHVFDPQVVVLGGGVCRDLHLFFPALKAAVRRRVMAQHKERVPIVASVLGDDAALLGAAHLAFQRGEPGEEG